MVWGAYWGYYAYPSGGGMTYDGTYYKSSGCYWSGGIEYCEQTTNGKFHYPPFGPYAYPWHRITIGGDGSHWGSSGG